LAGLAILLFALTFSFSEDEDLVIVWETEGCVDVVEELVSVIRLCCCRSRFLRAGDVR
jgi:hypothetical protein